MPVKKKKPVKAKKAATKPVKAVKKKTTAKKAVKAKPRKAAKAPSRPQKAKGRVSFKKEITKTLLEAKARLLQEVSQKVRSEKNVLKFEIGDIYDIASSERERELTLMLGDRGRARLAEIEDALERLEDNTYTVCDECGEPISEQRLRALPFTRVCVDCKSRHEREQKISRKIEEEPGLGIMEKSEAEDEEF